MRTRMIFGVLALAVLCSLVFAGDINWRKLESDLKLAVQNRNADAVKRAVVPLVNTGGKEAVTIVVRVLQRLPRSEDEIYWILVHAISTVTDPPSIDALAEYLVSLRGSLPRDIMFGLQTNRTLDIIPLLERVIEKCPPDMQRMAVEQLVNISEEECVDALLESGKSVKNPEIKDAIIEALRMITGADCGADLKDWKQWWETARNEGLPDDPETGKGYYGGGPRTSVTGKWRREKALGLEKLGALSALVITARCDASRAPGAICFDHLENTLSQMNINRTVIRRKNFEKKDYEIPEDTIAIFINCTQCKDHCICPNCRPGKTKSNRLYP